MKAKLNPFIGLNYLNRDIKMAVPPTYWLQRLYDFDQELVVFPSIQIPFAYCLARRAKRTGGMNQKVFSTGATPDTKFCLEHKLLPISIIYRHSSASWSIDNILAELRRRDTWAAGGGDAYADQCDAADAEAQRKLKAGIRDDMWQRSGDAWRSYQARTGQRSKLSSANRSSAIKIRSDSSSTASATAPIPVAGLRAGEKR